MYVRRSARVDLDLLVLACGPGSVLEDLLRDVGGGHARGPLRGHALDVGPRRRVTLPRRARQAPRVVRCLLLFRPWDAALS